MIRGGLGYAENKSLTFKEKQSGYKLSSNPWKTKLVYPNLVEGWTDFRLS